jgi:PDZ domain-containing protein
MRRMISGIAIMGLAAGCASVAHADGGKPKTTTQTHNVVVTNDGDDEQSRTVEVRVEDGNVVKFIVNGKEVDPSEVDWSDGFVRFHEGQADMEDFFVLSPNDEDFEFAFGDPNINMQFGGDAPLAPNKAVLGVQVEDSQQGGIKIVDLTQNGAALEAGFEVGDIIIKIDDENTSDTSALLHTLQSKKPGEKIKVLVTRNGDTVILAAKLKGAMDERNTWRMRTQEGEHAAPQWRSKNGNSWSTFVPKDQIKKHRAILKRHLRDADDLKHRVLIELEGSDLDDLSGLKSLYKLKGIEGIDELHMLEGLKGELLELKMLGDEGNAFAFGGADSSCDCDCNACQECTAGSKARSWAPKADAFKRRMHVELKGRADSIKKLHMLNKKQMIEIEKQIEHARRSLDNIDIDIDMPEIEVIIEQLDDLDGNVVFVPDAPKMRKHFRARQMKLHPDTDVVVETAPDHKIVKRLHRDDSAAGKLERESRLARFEDRLERLEKMIKQLLHEEHED